MSNEQGWEMKKKSSAKAKPKPNLEKPPNDFSFVLFERVNVKENASRFYYLGWLPTLLHANAVVRIYGRKGETQHTITPQPFNSLEEAWPLLRAIIRARLRNGYRVIEPNKYRRSWS